MTYLQIVNGVLRRLRERQVTSVSANTYSTMVGDFVNDAKTIVEGRWRWGALREVISVNTSDGVNTVDITGTNDETEILTLWNTTSAIQMNKASQAWFDRKNAFSVEDGIPTFFTHRASSSELKLELYPTPDGVYSLSANVYNPPGPWENDGDTCLIPALPIILTAAAMLAEEKGETGGTTSARYFQMAEKVLGDAITLDESRYPTELTWCN